MKFVKRLLVISPRLPWVFCLVGPWHFMVNLETWFWDVQRVR